MYVCVCVNSCVLHACGCGRNQMMMSYLLELELWAVVSFLMQVLGTQPEHSKEPCLQPQ